MMQAAYPVIISSNPLAILRSQDLIASINADSAFLRADRRESAAGANQITTRSLPAGERDRAAGFQPGYR